MPTAGWRQTNFNFSQIWPSPNPLRSEKKRKCLPILASPPDVIRGLRCPLSSQKQPGPEHRRQRRATIVGDWEKPYGENPDSNKEKQIWVIREKKTKAGGNNRKRPSLIQRKNENRKKIRRKNKRPVLPQDSSLRLCRGTHAILCRARSASGPPESVTAAPDVTSHITFDQFRDIVVGGCINAARDRLPAHVSRP